MTHAYINNPITKYLEHKNLYYFVLFIFAIVGLYARFKGIATWPLSDDEYHTVASVNNLLEHGYPCFECGGMYFRGILYQYFLAFLNIISGGNDILVYRSSSALISLFALPAIYLITKKLAGKESAILALLFYLVSIWEVEYARFIRMYMPFQVIFVWYLLCLYKVTIENNLNKLKLLLALSIVSVLVYEEGIFLTIINLSVLAFIDKSFYKEKIIWVYAILCIVISAVSLTYLQTDFRHYNVENHLPAGLDVLYSVEQANAWGPLQQPILLIPHLVNHELWLSIWALLFIPAIASLVMTTRYYRSWPIFLLAILVVLFATLNLFTLALLSIAIFYFLGWLSTERVPQYLYLHIIFVALIYGIFWISFSINTDTLTTIYGDDTIIGLKKALVVLFKYPNYYDQIIYPWFGAMPSFSIIFTAVILSGFALELIKKDRRNTFINQLFIITLLTLTMVAISVQPYHNTRYTFLLYPIVIILLVYYLHEIISSLKLKNHKNSTFLVSTLCLLYISDDHVFKYLINIDTKEINYKIGFSPNQRFHLRNRLDFITPANYINKHATPSDLIVTALRPIDYYIIRLDYYYITPEDLEFKVVSACGGTKELWTNANLLYSNNMLTELIETRTNRVWVIMHSDEFPNTNSMKKIFRSKYKDNIAYLSIDKHIAVYKFEPL